MAQGTAVSGVVGYETLPLAADQFNLIGVRLFGSVIDSGTSTDVTGATLTDDTKDWSGVTGPLVLEITSGDATGFASPVVAATATSLTTASDLTVGGLATGATYRVRNAVTIQSLFGDPATGLESGGSDADSDVVWLYDAVTGGYTRYIFQQPFFGDPRWYNVTADAAVTTPVPIDPTSGLFVEKRSEAGEVVVTGAVKTDPSVFLLTKGDAFTPVTSTFPVGATLQNSGLASVLTTSGGDADSDVVWIPQGTGYVRYFWQTPFFGDPRWYNVTADEAVGTEPGDAVPLTSGFFIERQPGGDEFFQFNSDPDIYGPLNN